MDVTARDMEWAIHRSLVRTSDYALPNFYPFGWFECDVCRITKAGIFYEYETKISRVDFKNDFKKSKTLPGAVGRKHDLLSAGSEYGPTRFYFVTTKNLISVDEVPEHAGLVYADGRIAEVIKKAPKLHGKKVSDSFMLKLYKSSYFRFWELRRLEAQNGTN